MPLVGAARDQHLVQRLFAGTQRIRLAFADDYRALIALMAWRRVKKPKTVILLHDPPTVAPGILTRFWRGDRYRRRRHDREVRALRRVYFGNLSFISSASAGGQPDNSLGCTFVTCSQPAPIDRAHMATDFLDKSDRVPQNWIISVH